MTSKKFLLAALASLPLLAAPPARADEALDAAIDTVAPEVKKWAAICVVTRDAQGAPSFEWIDYRGTGERTDFWPASTIKLYTAVAALEMLTERGFPLDTVVSFEHQDAEGRWVLDTARSVREMLSEVFRRSSNEDYTLLLRMAGIDRINTRFLIPEKGFKKSALMRGYVLGRPWVYHRAEPQRIRLRSADGVQSETHEHTWSGHSYSEERGATIIDAKTGNVTTPRDLVECLRRVLYHEYLPAREQFHLTGEQLAFLRNGGSGLSGLETGSQDRDSTNFFIADTRKIFPQALFYRKGGLITTYALEIGAVDGRAQGGPEYLLAPAIEAGSDAKPTTGPQFIGQMSGKIAEWLKGREKGKQGEK